MQIPNITLAYQVAGLKQVVEGSMLRKVQELENNWIKLKLQTKQGTKDLILTPNALFIAMHSMHARQNTSGYGALLRKHLQNKRILSFAQHGFDRIIVLEFQEYFLIVELFAKGNIVLADKEKKIISAYRKESWKDFQDSRMS